ncbi:MAG: metallophosphoesterase [Candidatus Bathyarchaeota archaeon]|nr:MAG: metallophosphoesterase [Candidatus Bathyarchaeota archaeon]
MIKPVRPFPALLLERDSERVLVVADLHIGWEAALADKGVHVPSQTPKILDKMLQLIKSCKPTSMVFLGDVKHAIMKVAMGEWRDIPDFFETISKEVSKIQVIPGNHDGNLEPLLPKTVEILSSKGAVFWDVGVFHGHAWPTPEVLGCRNLVTAHVHPMVAFRDPMGFRITRQVWVKATCDSAKLAEALLKHMHIKVGTNLTSLLKQSFGVTLKSSSKFLIMPSFNEFLGGQTINKRKLGIKSRSRTFIGPVLRCGSIDIDNAEAYLLDGTFVGNVEQLRSLVKS